LGSKYGVLYTVYQRMRTGFKQVRQYYAFRPRHCERVGRDDYPTSKDKYRCPACLRLFTDIALVDHTCLGGSDGYPKLAPSKFTNKERSTAYR
jgi:hypothetical protein